jgi:hypothetical protein
VVCIKIDFGTNRPSSRNGNETIVTIIDGLTKYVRWFTKSEAILTAEIFAAFFIENYIGAYAVSSAIMSDREVRFQRVFWKTFMTALGTKLYLSLVFNPQTDDLAEVAKDTVRTFLRADLTQNFDNLDTHLPLADITDNATVHYLTHISPYNADLGYVTQLPIDFMVGLRLQDTVGAQGGAKLIRQVDALLRAIREC